MSFSGQRFLGWSLAVFGVLIAVFSQQIVFPGLERLLGVEAIVGRDSVIYQPDGGYVFTNPGAMLRWISGVAAGGLVIAFIGAFVLSKARRDYRGSHVHTNAAQQGAPLNPAGVLSLRSRHFESRVTELSPLGVFGVDDMSFTIEQSKEKRESFGSYTYRVYEDGRLVAYYWHDYRGDEHGIEFTDGSKELWPVGRMVDFIQGGGPEPLTLSQRAVDYLKQKRRWVAPDRH